MRNVSRHLYRFVPGIMLALAISAARAQDQSVEERRRLICETVCTYLEEASRLNLENIEKLERIILFHNESERKYLRKIAEERPSKIIESLTYRGEVHIVSGPDSLGSGDYLFLVPRMGTYYPCRLCIRYDGGHPRIEYEGSHFEMAGEESERMSPEEELSRCLAERMQMWRSLEGRELTDRVAAWIQTSEDVILCLEYAERNNIPVFSTATPLGEQKDFLKRIQAASPQEAREMIVSDIKETLASMGHYDSSHEDQEGSMVPDSSQFDDTEEVEENEDPMATHDGSDGSDESHEPKSKSEPTSWPKAIPYLIALLAVAAVATIIVVLRRR